MKKVLAHSKTKGELTTFLAKNVNDNANGEQVIVAWGTECEAIHRDITRLRSTKEEADTKIILHALDASEVLPNSLYILLTLMFLFWLSDGIQICARTLALLLGPVVVVELSI